MQKGKAREVENLVGRLKEMLGLVESQEGDSTETIRYVIYARKSTESNEKQERSIGDQITVCRETAERLGIHIVQPPLHEAASAKISENRPVFRKMLDEILKGKYDGILTWAPDRLARNMKEAGEIIDLLDKGDIQDIKFANGYYFQNDAAGKMMLGIAFVQAKQFSDQHSQNVKRGNARITAEGKVYDRAKHGYYKDRNKFARPDGKNWKLLKRAFEMRLSVDPKYSLNDIAAWLREKDYPVATAHSKPKKIKVTSQFLSDLFRDPYYAGAFVRGRQVVNLLECYDFQPIITPEQFDDLTELDGLSKQFRLTEVVKPKGQIKADLLRGMVQCVSCARSMSTGITSKKSQRGTKNYFYFRCDTPGCERKGKSMRAKVILEAVYKFLDEHPMNLKAGYEAYKKEMQGLKKAHEKKLDLERKALRNRLRRTETELESAKRLLEEYGEEDVLAKEFAAEVKQKLKKRKSIKAQMKDVKHEKDSLNDTIKSYEEFIELFGNLAQQIKKIKKMEDLDFILRKLFSNFFVDGKKVIEIRQNSPFGELWAPNIGDGTP